MNMTQIDTQLDKRAKKSMDKKMDRLIQEVLSEIENRKEGPTFDEVAEWWNKNKNNLDE